MEEVYGGSSPIRNFREWRTHSKEACMTQRTKDQPLQSGQPHPSPEKELNKEKQKAAEHEVAGRHKNDGQNDHAGHKTNR